MTSKKYNPKNVAKYHGKTFVTASGSRYGISKDGKFTGRQECEGLKVRMIAGADNELYAYVVEVLTNHAGTRSQLEKLMQEKALEPSMGRHLAVSFDNKNGSQYGLVSSNIIDIQ